METAVLAWQRQYQHGNVAVSGETKMSGRSPITLAVPLLPGAAKLPCIPQVPPMGCGHWAQRALPASPPSPTAQHEKSWQVSAWVSQVLT